MAFPSAVRLRLPFATNVEFENAVMPVALEAISMWSAFSVNVAVPSGATVSCVLP